MQYICPIYHLCKHLIVWFSSHFQVDPSGEVLLFSQGGCPWKEHLFALEKELQVETPIKFVLYPDQNGQWRVQCVPAGLNTFQNRCYFTSVRFLLNLILIPFLLHEVHTL